MRISYALLCISTFIGMADTAASQGNSQKSIDPSAGKWHTCLSHLGLRFLCKRLQMRKGRAPKSDDMGSIRIVHRFASDMGAPQFSNPGGHMANRPAVKVSSKH
jgi:hypothetical protein